MTPVAEIRTRETEALARRALECYDVSPQATLTLTNASDNVIYRVDDPVTGERLALRVHRDGYHDRQQIKSELLWLDALRADRRVIVPPAVSAKNGERVLILDSDEGPRMITVNGWLEGAAPDESSDLAASWSTLGATAAKLHLHAIGWELPDGFCRPSWNADEFFGAHPALGHWRDGLGLDAESRRLLERAEIAVTLRLADLPVGLGQYGLIHADLRLANLRIDQRGGEEVVRVIDFDDCGRGWFMYDFGAAVSFVEHDPRLPEMLAAWTEGYRRVRALDAAQEAQLPTFVMLRRLALVGWVARNHETASDASLLDEGFTAGACEVAERYLSGTLAL